MIPDFYIHKAQRAFHGAYGDDPNVVSVDALMTGAIRVTLLDVNEGWFPTVIDGVPIQYVPAPRAQEAS